MPQLFSREATTRFRVILTGAVLGLAGTGAAAMIAVRTPSYWNVGEPAPQPIPFRHDLHAGQLGIGCRYCHATVERAAAAGMPSAGTCLSCHAQVWAGASVLQPVRTSAAFGRPIEWTSVHRLPDYVYFHHGIHVSKGVACESCHGPVETMAKIVKTETLSMTWCLDCHRDTMARAGVGADGPVEMASWGPHDRSLPADIKAVYRAAAARLTDCSTCHR